ncbi:hypothetical protein FIBSPDRAFT_886587 [Athelia psychrophila]|uniref:Uncharacterized protein n=1 Tax=Athelia psychrophila TaxID=1759441 RepID=A0A166QMW5_9AGAM|nr:hypothetical protein FIBSPDRAFT_886587 [Fibularhizoctonia sp. CBS 109695]
MSSRVDDVTDGKGLATAYYNTRTRGVWSKRPVELPMRRYGSVYSDSEHREPDEESKSGRARKRFCKLLCRLLLHTGLGNTATATSDYAIVSTDTFRKKLRIDDPSFKDAADAEMSAYSIREKIHNTIVTAPVMMSNTTQTCPRGVTGKGTHEPLYCAKSKTYCSPMSLRMEPSPDPEKEYPIDPVSVKGVVPTVLNVTAWAPTGPTTQSEWFCQRNCFVDSHENLYRADIEDDGDARDSHGGGGGRAGGDGGHADADVAGAVADGVDEVVEEGGADNLAYEHLDKDNYITSYDLHHSKWAKGKASSKSSDLSIATDVTSSVIATPLGGRGAGKPRLGLARVLRKEVIVNSYKYKYEDIASSRLKYFTNHVRTAALKTKDEDKCLYGYGSFTDILTQTAAVIGVDVFVLVSLGVH